MTWDMLEKLLVKVNKIEIERKNPPTTASFSVTLTQFSNLFCSGQIEKINACVFFLTLLFLWSLLQEKHAINYLQ